MKPETIQTAWTGQIPDDQWEVYHRVIRAARLENVRFAIGGAFAVATYTGRWRNTKDLDFYVMPQDKDALIAAITGTGMGDYFERLPYDRRWIYRAYRENFIVDVIWGMANGRAQVDETWLSSGPQIEVRGETLPIVPPEEMIWAKLYVLQKERCDWQDVMNLVYATGLELDWERMVTRMEEDLPILSAAMGIFCWLLPGRAQEFPDWLWERLKLPEPQGVSFPETVRQRASLLDTRPWFLPVIE